MVNGPGKLPDIPQAASLPPAPRPNPKPELKLPPNPTPLTQPPDRVTLSPEARQIQALAPKIQALPDVRPDKVEEVRQKLGNVSNDDAINARIAEKLLTGT